MMKVLLGFWLQHTSPFWPTLRLLDIKRERGKYCDGLHMKYTLPLLCAHPTVTDRFRRELSSIYVTYQHHIIQLVGLF